MSKVILGAGAGYVLALVTASLLPEAVSYLIPLLGAVIGYALSGRGSKRGRQPSIAEQAASAPSSPSTSQAPTAAPDRSATATTVEAVQAEAITSPAPQPHTSVFAHELEYMEVLEDMILSEGKKNNLDQELIDKSLALITRLQRLIPQIEELRSGDINHTIKRLVMHDLNSLINPFLRLTTEHKIRNRRVLLDGIKHVNGKIDEIGESIQQKELFELQSKAELISARYRNNEIY